MSNVIRLVPSRSPASTVRCLQKLLKHANDKGDEITGLAFVAYIDDHAFIADACGRARTDPVQTRLMLQALDTKLAKWARK